MNRSSTWGYVRETYQQISDPATQTAMIDYLHEIYPGHEWIHDQMIPKNVRESRGYSETLRIRPDFRCEELSIIVEFDGVQHYTDPVRIAKDKKNNHIYELMSYSVIRVPYWLSLSDNAIQCLFGVTLNHEMCTFTRSFSDNPDHGAGVSTAAFCTSGLNRFKDELRSLPDDLREMVADDLSIVQEQNPYGIDVPFSRIEEI